MASTTQAPTNAVATRVADLAPVPISDAERSVLEKVVIEGDLSHLTPDERLIHYFSMCRLIGDDPRNQPFGYLELDGKLTLYCRRQGTDAIRRTNRISISLVESGTIADGRVYRVEARAVTPDGRVDTATGAVPLVKEGIARDRDGKEIWKTSQNGKRYPQKSGELVPLDPMEFANAIMKAETKAKRRVTLSIVGFGMLDESELDTMARARIVTVDQSTGEILDRIPERVESAPNRNEPKDEGEDRRRAAKALWEATHLQFRWSKEMLQAVAVTLDGLALEEMDAGQLNDLRIRLLAMPAAERAAIAGVVATPDEPAAEAS